MFVYLASFLCILVYKYWIKPKQTKPPPGPMPLPLIGNALQVGKTPHLTFMRWAKEYGPIVKFKLGLQNWLVINDAELIKELFKNPNSSGKAKGPAFYEISRGYGFSFTDGLVSDSQRKCTLEIFKALYLTRDSWEAHILSDLEITLKWLRHLQNQPVSGLRIFSPPLSNTLWNILSGEKHDWSKGTSDFVKLADKVIATLFEISNNGLLIFPFLRHIFPDLMSWNTWVQSLEEARKVCESCVDKHLAAKDMNKLRDFTDHYLKNLQTMNERKSSFSETENRQNLVSILLELYIAGQPTATFLSWALFYLIYHQSVQTKLQQEINKCIKTNECVTLENCKKMPYMTATIYEVMRMASAVPIGNPHRLMQDIKFNGYLLKKDTIVVGNLYGVHHDPRIWGDPEVFRPERFLVKDGTRLNTYSEFLPFSVGNRKCIGETLAYDTMFLYLTSILKNFKLTAENCNEIPPLVPQTGGVLLEPMPFKVVFAPQL